MAFHSEAKGVPDEGDAVNGIGWFGCWHCIHRFAAATSLTSGLASQHPFDAVRGSLYLVH